MKKLSTLIASVCGCFFLNGQTLQDLHYGTDTTLEVLTWNTEWFPKNGQSTLNYISDIIIQLDADLIAIQEVNDTTSLKQMIASISGYTTYFKSSWFPQNYQKLAFIYKNSTVQINNAYEIYTTSPYWNPFPRAPMVIDFNFMGENYVVINNHFKCCGNGILDVSNSSDEENRRYIASNLLKQYIDVNFSGRKVIVVGDFNDLLTDPQANNVFQSILNDPQNYLFTDYSIASGSSSNWSYPSWPSHLDHILISNELFSTLEKDGSGVATIKIEEYLPNGWNEYEQNVSDHRPLGIKLVSDDVLGIDPIHSSVPSLVNYPNPFSNETLFFFPPKEANTAFLIRNVFGEIVFSEQLLAGQTSVIWNAEKLTSGVYFASIRANGTETGNSKVILSK